MMSALLVGLVALFGFLECAIGNSMVQRPIVMGPLVGLVLGDLQTGLLVGATLELAFMGNVTIGAALPPEITAGGILGTAFAITSGSGADVALALALPIATVALLVKNTYYLVVRSWFLHRADRYVEAGDDKGVARMHLLSFWSYAIVMSVIIAACFYAGSPAVEAFLAVIPQFVKDGLSVAAGILPALAGQQESGALFFPGIFTLRLFKNTGAWHRYAGNHYRPYFNQWKQPGKYSCAGGARG